jgi:hypothetical protein
MFIGHAALAFASKKAGPDVSLGLYFVAAFWLDLAWPVFLLMGIEQVRIEPGNTRLTPLDFSYYPWTHSLALALAWSALFALVSSLWVRRWRDRALLGGLVLSHWLLDVVVHRPDLPLWPGDSPRLGLGLWNSVSATLLVEGGLYAAGLCLYLRETQPRDAVGRYALWTLVVLCPLIWLANFASPPPPSTQALAWLALACWLLPLWAWWADRHRTAAPPTRASRTGFGEQTGIRP